MSLLSLNRKFQDLSAEKNKKGLSEMQKRVQHDRKMSGERKNAMRCVGKDNAVREQMQCGDFIVTPHCVF